MSVTEMAHLRAVVGREDELEGALPPALTVIEADGACLSARAYRCVERPTEFTLTIVWRSVADHERFRGTEGFDRYRAAIAGALEEVVGVAHYTEVGAA